MTKSSLALSNLRGFAIVMVVAFHSCIAYLNSQPDAALPFDIAPYGWRANPIVDSARWLGFDLFCAFQYIYLMQLLFFLSGLFVWPSLSRKGGGKFLYDRFLRLGVPFALDCAAVLAERADVVPVAAAGVQRRGRRALLAGSARGRSFGRTVGQSRQPSRPILHRAGERLGAGLFAARHGVRALAMDAIRPVRVSTEPCAAIRHLLLRRSRRRNIRVRSRPALGRWNAGAAMGALARRHRRRIPAVGRTHDADRPRNAGAGPAPRRQPRPRAVPGERVSRAGGGLLALY